MLICKSCGLEFWLQSSAWSDGTWGACIAERIHEMLMGNMPRTRCPMRRASDNAEPTPTIGDFDERRAPGE